MWFWDIAGWILGIWCIWALLVYVVRRLNAFLYRTFKRSCYWMGRTISWSRRVASAPTQL